MSRIGLVAGEGALPIEFIKQVKRSGGDIVVFALEGMASPEVESLADRTYRVRAGKFMGYVVPLLTSRVRKLAFLGKINKNIIYDKSEYDAGSRVLFARMGDKKDTTILAAITKVLKFLGVEVMDTRKHLSHLMPDKGVLGSVKPQEQVSEDMKFGFDTAKKLSKMDIGQTVIIKNKSVVAVEAMEGTDEAIARGRQIAGDGCVMVKVSRPDQDYRWDVPTVGARTMKRLAENGYKGLAVESGRMYLMERDRFIRIADENNIAVVGM